MKKLVLFMAAGLLSLVSVGQVYAVNPSTHIAVPSQGAAWTLANTFGDWQLVCTEQGDKSCRALQTLDLEQGEQSMRLLEVMVFYAGDQARMNMTFPLGLDLLAGIVLKVDENDEIGLPFSTCLADGCRVIGNIGDDVMAQLMAGNVMKVGFRGFGEEQTLVLDVSLRGSASAFRAAEARPVAVN
ncbi:invasion associated locus B family protein [Thiomicrospira sp. ALE5]|uniref:invasion associated locus B family protein n=1 Tax=Thiomicrospira sp. ALE5 TaxID=748650 RepID=UPI0008DF074F|nr:invasion associated locus B family protein [Thiomicrospira sp. ALE5]SFR60717.1 Invasion protein IalB, involved in pathogenesis [Thiomicrospira sp. ALE5]